MQKLNMEELVIERILTEYEKLYRVAYTYVRNESDAMDIVQESAYKAITNYYKVKQPEFITTWLYKVVINTALDLLRNQKKEIIGLEGYNGEYMDRYENFETIEALNVLETRERTVIILRFFEERKLSEIAQILELNINTVKSILYRSLEKLKVEMTKGAEIYVN